MTVPKISEEDRESADELRRFWRMISDTVVERLTTNGIDQNSRTVRMVLSALMLMSARTAVTHGMTDDGFQKVARMAFSAARRGRGTRHTTRLWVTAGGLG